MEDALATIAELRRQLDQSNVAAVDRSLNEWRLPEDFSLKVANTIGTILMDSVFFLILQVSSKINADSLLMAVP